MGRFVKGDVVVVARFPYSAQSIVHSRFEHRSLLGRQAVAR